MAALMLPPSLRRVPKRDAEKLFETFDHRSLSRSPLPSSKAIRYVAAAASIGMGMHKLAPSSAALTGLCRRASVDSLPRSCTLEPVGWRDRVIAPARLGRISVIAAALISRIV